MPRYDEQTLRRFIMAIKFEELNKDGSVKRQFKGVKWIALAAAVAVLAAASFTNVRRLSPENTVHSGRRGYVQ